MGELSAEERFLHDAMNELETKYGAEIAQDKYKSLMGRLREIDAAKKGGPHPPAQSATEVEMRQAIRTIGAGIPKNAIIDQWGIVEPQKIFESTRKWHLAAAKVFEYCEAQLNMDLFKGDPEATQIFKQLIVKGFQALQNEAGGGH